MQHGVFTKWSKGLVLLVHFGTRSVRGSSKDGRAACCRASCRITLRWLVSQSSDVVLLPLDWLQSCVFSVPQHIIKCIMYYWSSCLDRELVSLNKYACLFHEVPGCLAESACLCFVTGSLDVYPADNKALICQSNTQVKHLWNRCVAIWWATAIWTHDRYEDHPLKIKTEKCEADFRPIVGISYSFLDGPALICACSFTWSGPFKKKKKTVTIFNIRLCIYLFLQWRLTHFWRSFKVSCKFRDFCVDEMSKAGCSPYTH